MKRAEITPCLGCRRPVGHANGLLFYQVTIERLAFDHRAIQTTAGLDLQLRSPALVDAFNPDPELAKPLGDPEKFLLCDPCAMKSYPLAALEELAIDRRATDAGDGNPTPETSAPARAERQTDNPADGVRPGAQRPGRPLPVSSQAPDVPPSGEAA